MSVDTLIAGFAVVVSLIAAYFSWRASIKSNELNRINALIALREHYFATFRREAEFIDRHKDFVSAVRASAKNAGEAADRMREIDAFLAKHTDQLLHELRT